MYNKRTLLRSNVIEVEMLVVGGGGGGGQIIAGGGGAGGLVNGTLYAQSGSSFAVTLGGGGNGSINYNNDDTSTSGTGTELTYYGPTDWMTKFSHKYQKAGATFNFDTLSTIEAPGGGHGSGWTGTNYAINETPGGSGGGGSANGTSPTSGHGARGAGPTITYVNGFPGGYGSNTLALGDGSGGGGGGAGAAGANGTQAQGGAGGNGIESSITGTPTYYAGGGGGGTRESTGTNYGTAGLGGGGRGGWKNDNSPGSGTGYCEHGTAATGGGGGGGGYSGTNNTLNPASGNGGSGTAIFRMPIGAYDSSNSDTANITHTVDGQFDVIVFSNSGHFAIKTPD